MRGRGGLWALKRIEEQQKRRKRIEDLERSREGEAIWRPWHWLVIDSGKYNKRGTLPELVFQDIRYFRYMCNNGYFRAEFADQALRLDQLASRILPFKKRPEKYEFAIIAAGNKSHQILHSIVIVEKSAKSVPGIGAGHPNRRLVKRAPVLDLSIWTEFPSSESASSKKLIEFVTTTWFGAKDMPSRQQAENFFDTEQNFDMTTQLLSFHSGEMGELNPTVRNWRRWRSDVAEDNRRRRERKAFLKEQRNSTVTVEKRDLWGNLNKVTLPAPEQRG